MGLHAINNISFKGEITIPFNKMAYNDPTKDPKTELEIPEFWLFESNEAPLFLGCADIATYRFIEKYCGLTPQRYTTPTFNLSTQQLRKLQVTSKSQKIQLKGHGQFFYIFRASNRNKIDQKESQELKVAIKHGILYT